MLAFSLGQIVDYCEYIKSDKWRRIRLYKLHLARYQCEVCGTNRMLQVHHRRYPLVLGTEGLADLQALCAHCHRKRHPKHIDRCHAVHIGEIIPKVMAKIEARLVTR